jgi:ABC-type multidrug transport system fused ATPase/permease subunit
MITNITIFLCLGERIVQRLRNKLFQSILKQDISFFDAERSGDLISRLSSDTNVMGKSITQNINDGIPFFSFFSFLFFCEIVFPNFLYPIFRIEFV